MRNQSANDLFRFGTLSFVDFAGEKRVYVYMSNWGASYGTTSKDQIQQRDEKSQKCLSARDNF
jgi:hypothetical protein